MQWGPMIFDQAAAHNGYLTGKLLIAWPSIGDQRFSRSVIYICTHNEEGAMGLILNNPMPNMTFRDLLAQIGIEPQDPTAHKRLVHYGGPVETGRGFILHSLDFRRETTLSVDEEYGLTATMDILETIANGTGPQKALLALGYAGWGPGQLEQELQANGWLTADADDELIFDEDLPTKWERALNKIGAKVEMLSGDAGHA